MAGTELQRARRTPTPQLLWDFWLLTQELRKYPAMPLRGSQEWPVYEAQRQRLEITNRVIEEREEERRAG